MAFDKERMTRKLSELKKVIVIIIILLLFNFYFAWRYFETKRAFSQIKEITSANINEDVLNFTKFFIDNVIKVDREVSLETRLKMENEVRNLNDEQILKAWENFVNSQTEDEAQKNIRELLLILINKIKK
ncbi:MAG: hypothetical protein NZ822_01090 [Patescibacteria group bacterium]|nr:hypothetical protein [Patescibacteria group bacterium]